MQSDAAQQCDAMTPSDGIGRRYALPGAARAARVRRNSAIAARWSCSHARDDASSAMKPKRRRLK